MTWLVLALMAWTAVAPALGLLVGRCIRLGDGRDATLAAPAVPDFVPAEWSVSSAD